VFFFVFDYGKDGKRVLIKEGDWKSPVFLMRVEELGLELFKDYD
jgi:hypothetical protein